jgi:Cof subfamily protein (haloacid dehalogenase superfamily)
MQKSYKLLVVDIDGTLLNSRGVVSTEDAEAIANARKAGVIVAVSTGRAAMAARWVLEQLQLDGHHIFFDGALVYDPITDHEAYAESIGGDLAQEAIDFARQVKIHCDLYTSSRYYIEHDSWAVDIRRSFFRIEPTFRNLDDVCHQERIIKGTVIVRTSEEKSLAHEFQNKFSGRLSFSWTMTPAYPDVNFINVVSPRVSKGKALEALCAFHQIPLSQVVAIGDGINDVSLLKSAGLAVAMGNCVEELKTVAQVVTHDVDHGGVAEAIKRYLI